MKRRAARGVTLIEAMVAVALIAIMAGGMFVGLGGLSSARLRESSTAVASAIRIAYNHANATSRPTRLVFDFETRSITIEESAGRMLIQKGMTGGAAAANDIEQAVVAEAEAILEGPRAPRASFTPVGKVLGFEYDEDKQAGKKMLAEGIFFRRIEVGHDDFAATEGRAYLYFWPGGQTELASIQIQKTMEDVDDKDILSITVSPLTGKTAVKGGPVDMRRPVSDAEMSERADRL